MSREIMDHIGELYARHAALETRLELMVRPGTVADLDFSDPTKPRARIAHGRDQDGGDVLGPWLPFMTHAGEMNRWNPPTLGMQMMQFAPDGVVENGHLIPFTHSAKVPAPSTDPDRHVSQFGDHREDHGKRDHTRTIGGTSVHQDTSDHRVNVAGKHEITAGDPAAAASSGAGSLGEFPHEMNRIVQGFAARLDQHDHHIGALHDLLSQVNQLAIPKVPSLLALAPMLNRDPSGLLMGAEQMLGKLPSYSASAIQQTLAKLLGGSPLGAVQEIVQANIAGRLGGLIGQAEAALSGAGLGDAAMATATMVLGQAQAAASAAAAGGTFELGAALQSLTNLAAGTAAAGPLAAVVGQMQGLMGSTASLMGGMSGLLDGQVNATKGTIRSALFGGYGS